MSQPKTVREGGRWRGVERPPSEEVADWFKGVRLDDGMSQDDYISGVVLIPAQEKIKKPKPDGRGTEEQWEQTWTPYTRVDTRVAYFHRLAELRECVAVIEPVQVPRTEQAAFRNDHMPDGLWWHIAGEQQDARRYLCATWRVALYREDDWFSAKVEVIRPGGPDEIQHHPVLRAVREGRGTKAVTGAADINGIAKADTGAIGRALGVAGVLVVGTGIATAEDLEQLTQGEEAAPVALPVAGAPEEGEEALNERLMSLQARLRGYPDAWREFSNWWTERAKASGWKGVNDAPVEARRGVASKMEAMILELPEEPPLDDSSSPVDEPSGDE